MQNQNHIEPNQNEELSKINPGQENRVFGFLSFFWDLVKTFVIVMMIAFAIRYFIIQPFVVDGDSMLPNFINNEYLIAEKISYDFVTPARGDVVIFRYPKNPEVIYIKRVIGLPGETVEIKDGKINIIPENGNIWQINEDYLPATETTNIYTNGQNSGEFKIKLKEKEFFVLGDNRDHSSDSREWGVLPQGNIIGRVWITVTPINRFKIFGHLIYNS